MLWPSNNVGLFGRSPHLQHTYGAYRQQFWQNNGILSFFANAQFASYTSIPENTFGTASNILPPLDGGGMVMQSGGAGSMSANLYPSRNMSINLTGAGVFSATAGLVISMLCNMSGSGTLTATIQGRLNASVNFTGSGGMTAALSGIGNMLANLSGAGDLDATIAAYGNMDIDIVVTGTGLTTANVGQAVWDTLIEAGYSAEEILKLIAASAAGKTTNNGETLLGIDGTTQRIVGTVSGNDRTAASYDVS